MSKPKYEIATFGGGCFWCTEAIFQRIEGVKNVTSGYSGGTSKSISYDEVSGGNTGFVEVINLEFDPHTISYRELVDIFFHVHDPTTLNRQGADVGSQYRSVIFYHSDSQKQIATEVLNSLQEEFDNKIVTVIEEFKLFVKAEDYHQNFYNSNPDYGYCRLVIDPKLKKLLERYPAPKTDLKPRL